MVEAGRHNNPGPMLVSRGHCRMLKYKLHLSCAAPDCSHLSMAFTRMHELRLWQDCIQYML
jgi:hypothetical protein